MNQVEEFLKNNPYKTVAITGNAGSGKTTLVGKLSLCFDITYHLDSQFIGNSDFRRSLLKNKAKDLNSYIDACNQYNWWDWDTIYNELKELKGNVLVEGAILGPHTIITHLDIIIFKYVPRNIRLSRLLERDKNKRNFQDSLARFLITEYSENLYYDYLLDTRDILFINEYNQFISPSRNEIIDKSQYLPLDLVVYEHNN